MSRKDPQYKRKFVAWFKSLPKDKNIVRFFDNNSGLYTVYGRYALEFAEQYLKTKQVVYKYGPPSEGSKKNSNDNQLDCLRIKHSIGHKVITDCAKTKKIEIYFEEGNQWVCKQQASPGNTSGIDDIMGMLGDSAEYSGCSLMAVLLDFQANKLNIGVGMVNTNACKFEISQFIENERYSTLQSLILAKGVKECIYHCNQSVKLFETQIETFTQSLAKCNVSVTESHKSVWLKMKNDRGNAFERLNKLLSDNSRTRLTSLQSEHPLSIGALVAQIYNLGDGSSTISDGSNDGTYILSEYRSTDFMKLDAPAMIALNLFPSFSDTNKNMSVYGILNKCKSAMGIRLLQTWIRQPLIDYQEIIKRQKLVSIFTQNAEQLDQIHHEFLKGMPDLERIRLKLQRNKGGLKECLLLYTFCKKIEWIREALHQMVDAPFNPKRAKGNDDNEEDIAMAAYKAKEERKEESPVKLEKLSISGKSDMGDDDDDEEDIDIKMDALAVKVKKEGNAHVKEEKENKDNDENNDKNGKNEKKEKEKENDDSKDSFEKYSEMSCLAILKKVFLDEIDDVWDSFNNFMFMIQHVINLDQYYENGDCLVKASFDPHLQKFEADKQSVERKMVKLTRKLMDWFNMNDGGKKRGKRKSLAGKSNPLTWQFKETYGYHFRATKKAGAEIWGKSIPTKGTSANSKKKYSKSARKSKNSKGKSNGNDSDGNDFDKDDFYVYAKLKDSVLFSNAQMTQLSGDCIEADKKYRDRQQCIVAKTVEITNTYMPVLNKAIKIFSELDVILSFAFVAHNAVKEYVCPLVLPSGSGVIRMHNARHPCLELQDNIGGATNYSQECIPNDVEMIQRRSSFQIVTGPNMGGKSTYIRMIGIITLLAQIGCYVPCEAATVTIVDSILARVGAGDSQMKGVSTFMAEMLETSAILAATTNDSLVIIDELGRGTSTYDGYGIAHAISEELAFEKRCFGLFATHFHELTHLAKKDNCVVNKHVLAIKDDANESLKMVYKVQTGPITRSFGIEVAEMANFPASVIEAARKKAEELETFEKENVADLDIGTFMVMREILQKYESAKSMLENKEITDDQFATRVKSIKESIEDAAENNDQIADMANDMKSKMKRARSKSPKKQGKDCNSQVSGNNGEIEMGKEKST